MRIDMLMKLFSDQNMKTAGRNFEETVIFKTLVMKWA